ncbi:MAG: hypothetical protein Q7J35_00155 [Candidatus Methanoperedens sp.]|nr:hypothetical protein [Candidatus Methanoperedens sp.]
MAQKKHCAVCSMVVRRGEGMFYNKRLIHKKCLIKARLIWYRL